MLGAVEAFWEQHAGVELGRNIVLQLELNQQSTSRGKHNFLDILSSLGLMKVPTLRDKKERLGGAAVGPNHLSLQGFKEDTV